MTLAEQQQQSGREIVRAEQPTAVMANGGPSVASLLELAITQKVDVSVLKQLVELQADVNARNARASFIEAMSRFQEAITEIPQKRIAKIVSKKHGTSFSYKYAQLQDIVRIIKEPLKANGLSYTWTAGRIDGGNLYIACTLRHIDGHQETSEFPVPLEGTDRMSPAQRNGAAYTYGRRQSLVAVLGLAMADEDTDAVQSEAENQSPEVITESEAADLSALADEIGGSHSAFLAMFGVERFSDIRKTDLATAHRALEQKRQKQKSGR